VVENFPGAHKLIDHLLETLPIISDEITQLLNAAQLPPNQTTNEQVRSGITTVRSTLVTLRDEAGALYVKLDQWLNAASSLVPN
jgi:hypothetical protein